MFSSEEDLRSQGTLKMVKLRPRVGKGLMEGNMVNRGQSWG